jgi:twitching motility protein PilT
MDYKQEIQNLIQTVVAEGASDLHISEGRYPTLRVSGDLIPLVKKAVLSGADCEGLTSALLTEDQRKRLMANKDVDFSYSSPDGARFRGNAFYQRGFVGSALRLIPKQVKTLAELNLPEALGLFARREQGFFLVVGAVGQGKSTTLASLVELVNSERAEHIITIEDPIEYIFTQNKSIIDQREVRYDTEDFATALRSMFRQDVNVAMIGEMRGPETIATAVTAAETGHLIFSTLHTNNAAQTIDRIIDSFPGDQQNQIRTQLAGSLIGVFSQRLVPRISGGRIPAYELMLNNNAIGNLIREARTHEINSVIETSREDGMISMNFSLAELVRRGEIAAEEALSHTLDVKGLERLM